MLNRFLKCYIQGWIRYFDFIGISSRADFWCFTIINATISLILSLIIGVKAYQILASYFYLDHLHYYFDFNKDYILPILDDLHDPLFKSLLNWSGIGIFWQTLYLCPFFALVVRRLNSLQLPKIYLLLVLIPIIGILILMVIISKPEEKQPDNIYNY